MHSKIAFIGIIMCIMLALIHMISILQQRKIEEEYKLIKSVKVTIPMEKLTMLTPKSNIQDASENKNNNYKFIIYHDSLQCSSCELKRLTIWNSIISKSKASGVGMDYYFIFSPLNGGEEKFKSNYLDSRLLYPIYIDSEGKFSQDNPFIHQSRKYRCFVLNEDNRIVFIGDPTKNLDIENLYIEFLEKLKLQ